MDLLTTKQASEILGLHHVTLANWRAEGFGPKFVALGRAIRYRRDDLEAFVEQQLRQSTSDASDER